MSYFPISWPGNKRQELDKVMPHINLNDYDVIVEPFGGSAAFSLAAFCGGAKEKHYVVGDTDEKLFWVYEALRERGVAELLSWCEERANPAGWAEVEQMDEQDPMRWVYRQKVKDFLATGRMPKRWPKCQPSRKHLQADEFWRHAEVRNSDWKETIAPWLENPRALIFLDPPYFNSWNQSYAGDHSTIDAEGRLRDGTTIFTEILDLCEKTVRDGGATVVMVSSGCALLERLYKPFVREIYTKVYGTNVVRKNGETIRKSTSHIVVVSSPAGQEET